MKVEFLTELYLHPLGPEEFTLLAPFVFLVDGARYEAPTGFLTDLDSIPRLPFAYWIAKGRAIKSFVMHDLLYELQVPRKWADDAMRAGMAVENVTDALGSLMYGFVRLGGSSHYAVDTAWLEEG
ncbi:MAG: DUF1353 domain-containing protein [Candidatus Nanopelagicales bacterium]|nr:DUF1353 domain-containing protein [Candidatus Nanopelagicales bacterium]